MREVKANESGERNREAKRKVWLIGDKVGNISRGAKSVGLSRHDQQMRGQGERSKRDSWGDDGAKGEIYYNVEEKADRGRAELFRVSSI